LHRFPSDKNYITYSEWTRDFGGVTQRKTDNYKRLPFNFCALSLQPFENPVCTDEGSIFDLLYVLAGDLRAPLPHCEADQT